MMLAMKLIEHVKSEGGTGTATCPVIAAIAGRAGCSPGTLYLIALGHKQPSAKLAGRISDATANSTTRHDLLPDVFPAQAA